MSGETLSTLEDSSVKVCKWLFSCSFLLEGGVGGKETSMPLSLCSVESRRSAKRGGWGDESREAGLALIACLTDNGKELRLGDPLRPT